MIQHFSSIDDSSINGDDDVHNVWCVLWSDSCIFIINSTENTCVENIYIDDSAYVSVDSSILG